MKRIYLSFGVALLLMSAPFQACNDLQEPGVGPDTNQESPEVVSKQKTIMASLSDLPLAKGFSRMDAPIEDVSEAVEVEGSAREEKTDGTFNGMPGHWISTSKKYKMTQVFDEAIILNPNMEIMYPGCVMEGSSFVNKSYNPMIEVPTRETTLSVNLVPTNPNQLDDITVTLAPNSRLSDFRKIWAKWTRLDVQPVASTSIYSLDLVNSEKEVKTKIGLSVGVPGILNLNGNFGFDFHGKKNHIFCKFIQTGYSITMDAPKFGTILAEALPEKVGRTQPVYISNINYGRIAFVSIETNEKLTDIQAALDFTLDKAVTKGKFELGINNETKYKNILKDQKVSYAVIGGSAAEQGKIMEGTLESFIEYMKMEPTLSSLAPVSFTIRYVSDNTIARVVNTSEYDVVEKLFVPDFKQINLEVAVTGIAAQGEIDKNNEIIGRVWIDPEKAKFDYENQDRDLLNWDKQRKFKENEGFHRIDEGVKYIYIPLGDKDPEDILNSVIVFRTDLKDKGPLGVTSKPYSQGKYEISVKDLLVKAGSPDNSFIISSHNNSRLAQVRIEVKNAYYVTKKGAKLPVDLPSR